MNRYSHHAHDYASSLLRGLHRLQVSQQFCDVEFKVGQKSFKVHRAVVSAGSPYFGAMLGGHLVERAKDSIEIFDVKPDVFSSIIDFLYTGEVTVTETNCQELMTAADMFSISEVIEACCTFLTNHLCPANALGIYMFSDVRNCVDLRDIAEQYVCNRFPEVVQAEEFCDLPRSILIHFLHSENLHIESEFEVFRAALRWIQHDAPARRKYLFEVLSPVRFPIIPQKSLLKYIENCSDLSIRVALQKHTQDFQGIRKLPFELKMIRLKPYMLHPRKRSRKTFYVIGGYSRDVGGRWGDSNTLPSLECFNSFTQQWRALAPMRHPRSGHGTAVLNGNIYVAGGESDALIYDSCERYDPATGKWTVLPSMTVPRCGLGLCALDGQVYALGGWVGTEIGNTVEMYSPSVGHWQQTDTVTTLRFAMGVAAHQGLIYIIGGMNDLGTEVDTVYSYNPVTHEWTTLSPLLYARAYVGITVLDDHIYVLGGWNETHAALAQVECYSIKEDKWRELPPMTHPRGGAAAAAINGLVYVIGGRTTSDRLTAPVTLASVECYDPQVDSWFDIEPMPSHRCDAMVAVL